MSKGLVLKKGCSVIEKFFILIIINCKVFFFELQIFKSYGLMSGTSIDGIDISIIKTNGSDVIRLNKNFYYPYKKYKIKTFILYRKL